MAAGTLTESVKTRIPEEWKAKLEHIAESETLDVSDIVRRAIAEFIARRNARKTKR
jgi:predicted transcriptional regulator